jgi:hypothetical protein
VPNNSQTAVMSIKKMTMKKRKKTPWMLMNLLKAIRILNADDSSESTLNHDEDDDGTDDDHSSDGNNDLSCLNTVSLQKKITSEVKIFQFLLYVYTIC